MKTIVITGSSGKFCGGFDIGNLRRLQGGVVQNGGQFELTDVLVRIMTELFEDAKKPTVAAIDGLALDGGLEIAMTCHGRIVAPQAQLQLGIIPGLDGIQRLPCLVGLSKALQLTLLSKLTKSEVASELGLVDAIVPPVELLNTACRWALKTAEICRNLKALGKKSFPALES